MLETDTEKRVFAKNDSELKEQWQNIVQFEIISKWVQSIDDQKEKGNKDGNKSEVELKAEAVKDVKKI